MSNSAQTKKNYQLINLSLASIIFCIFIYSSFFSPEESKHLIPSYYTQITNETSPSTGLSRSFSAIVRGDLALAKEYNPIGLPIFLFFSLQFIFRSLSPLLIKERFAFTKPLILIDITLSILGFYLAFRPLIVFTIKLFYKTIVNC